MVENQDPDRDVLGILSDDVAKTILTVTDQQAMSAQALEARCDASLATIYRRVDELLASGLLRERLELRPDGNHHKTFESNLDQLSVRLDDGSLEIDVDRRDDAADRLRTIWDAMQPRWR
ncbi:helix-turn-helix domain-containing protein [Haloarchaeobius baliensis]|uniref:helix-turn-helix domain-containing protein n=1 Tax=Haloarchaeobius baliensis TaxID=1670458 RepID=UPI003F882C8C